MSITKGLYKICPKCGVKFKARKCSIYCSRACRNKANPIKYTDERKQKHSEACKGNNSGEKNPAYGRYGKDSWSYGTKRTWEEREKMSLIKKGKNLGRDNYNWKGGESKSPYPFGWNSVLKERIRTKDSYKCKVCGGFGKDVHHIDYNKNNIKKENLVTLCRSCHSKTNFNKEEWINLFLDAGDKISNIKILDGVKQ